MNKVVQILGQLIHVWQLDRFQNKGKTWQGSLRVCSPTQPSLHFWLVLASSLALALHTAFSSTLILLHFSIALLITSPLSISPPRAFIKSVASISAVGKPSSSSQTSAGDR